MKDEKLLCSVMFAKNKRFKLLFNIDGSLLSDLELRINNDY